MAASKKNILISTQTEEEKLQVTQLYDLDLLLAAKRYACGLFTPPGTNMDDLVLLLIRKGLIFPSDIAGMLGHSGSRITFLLNTLSGKGFIVRNPAGYDRRKVICGLTIKGRRKADSLSREWKQNIMWAIQKMDNGGFVDMMTDFMRICLEKGDKDER